MSEEGILWSFYRIPKKREHHPRWLAFIGCRNEDGQYGNQVKLTTYALIILYISRIIFTISDYVPSIHDLSNCADTTESSVLAHFERTQQRYKQQQEKERDCTSSSIIMERNLRAFYHDHTYVSKITELRPHSPQQIIVKQAIPVTSSSNDASDVISAEVG